jgi:hypothetical protein
MKERRYMGILAKHVLINRALAARDRSFPLQPAISRQFIKMLRNSQVLQRKGTNGTTKNICYSTSFYLINIQSDYFTLMEIDSHARNLLKPHDSMFKII